MTTQTTRTNSVEITSGPSAGEIWDAAKYAYSNRFTVRFIGMRTFGRVKGRVEIVAQITGIMHEDGSNTSFIVHANILSGLPGYTTKVFYYNARTRKGHLDLTK